MVVVVNNHGDDPGVARLGLVRAFLMAGCVFSFVILPLGP